MHWKKTRFSKLPVLLKNRKLTYLLLALIFSICLILFTSVPLVPHFRRTPKVVIVLGANKGGGVLQLKSARDWELEKLSIANKKAYAKRHGYQLAIKDMTAKRKYTQEWREAWEKADILKETMRQFPDAEWFWWLDLNSYIMEPQKSLEKVVLNKLQDLDKSPKYNPSNFKQDLAMVNKNQPVNLILTQDCSGFSLGSFLIRRSEWSDMLLDILWDPVFYEQKYMEWSHVEQSALEYFYDTQPWIRAGTAFAKQRQINAYPHGACGQAADNPQIFYSKRDRDFMVNLAGCDWGRDCWAEMREFAGLAKKRRFWLF